MAIIKEFYETAKRVNEELLHKLRRVTGENIIRPDDYNVTCRILNAYLETFNRLVPLYSPERPIIRTAEVKYKDAVLSQHINDFKSACSILWDVVYRVFGEPYSKDRDFMSLEMDIRNIPYKSYGMDLTPHEWNAVFDFCRKFTAVALKYPPTPEQPTILTWFENIVISVFSMFSKAFPKMFSEAISLAETFSTRLIKVFSTTISTTITDAYVLVKHIYAILSEAVSVVVDSSIIRGFIKTFSEAISLAEEFGIYVTRILNTSISTAISDAYELVNHIYVALSEAISVVVNSSIIRGFIKTFSETLSLTETFSTCVYRTFNTSIHTSISDQYAMTLITGISWSETISTSVSSTITVSQA